MTGDPHKTDARRDLQLRLREELALLPEEDQLATLEAVDRLIQEFARRSRINLSAARPLPRNVVLLRPRKS